MSLYANNVNCMKDSFTIQLRPDCMQFAKVFLEIKLQVLTVNA